MFDKKIEVYLVPMIGLGFDGYRVEFKNYDIVVSKWYFLFLKLEIKKPVLKSTE